MEYYATHLELWGPQEIVEIYRDQLELKARLPSRGTGEGKGLLVHGRSKFLQFLTGPPTVPNVWLILIAYNTTILHQT